jgi:hypothetical protein
LYHAAVDLAFDDLGIDHAAAVLGNDVSKNSGSARLAVDFDDA